MIQKKNYMYINISRMGLCIQKSFVFSYAEYIFVLRF